MVLGGRGNNSEGTEPRPDIEFSDAVDARAATRLRQSDTTAQLCQS